MLQIIFFFPMLLLVACGKKKKDVFTFTKKQQHPSSSLCIESVKKCKAFKKGANVFIEWGAINLTLAKNQIFLGYNVYRLRSWGIIPKKPLNKNPIKETGFIDKKPSDDESCYIVRAVIQEEKRLILGTASKVISLSAA